MPVKHTPGPAEAVATIQDILQAELDAEIDNVNNGNEDAQRNVIYVLEPTLEWLDSNRHLIAAAPDLLEAAYEALDCLLELADENAHHQAFWNKGGNGFEASEALRAAIAKAKGEASA